MTNNKPILSAEPTQAVKEMLEITEELCARMDIETNALAQNDGTSFSMNEMDKEHVAKIYDQAAAEFHGRLGEFQGVDKALMDKLQNAVGLLRQSTMSGLRIMERIDPQSNNPEAIS
ncbi:MAG: hypothetical protein HRT94_06785 [Alphaproteobacteria bacterium]|nr:hypothetical protein [Alphaproteobacteria bacterium]